MNTPNNWLQLSHIFMNIEYSASQLGPLQQDCHWLFYVVCCARARVGCQLCLSSWIVRLGCWQSLDTGKTMSGLEQKSHRAGLLKQANKSHKNGRHRSKSAIDKDNKGGTSRLLCSIFTIFSLYFRNHTCWSFTLAIACKYQLKTTS